MSEEIILHLCTTIHKREWQRVTVASFQLSKLSFRENIHSLNMLLTTLYFSLKPFVNNSLPKEVELNTVEGQIRTIINNPNGF